MSHVFCYFPFSRASCAPLSVCLSVRLSVSLNVCLRHEFGAPLILMATWLLLSLHTCSKPHTCNPSTHPLFSISTLVLQPLTARQLLQSVRFIVTQALWFVVSSYSSCVYSPFTCFFFCLFVFSLVPPLGCLAVHCPVYSSATQLASSWCPRIPHCSSMLSHIWVFPLLIVKLTASWRNARF